MKKTLAERRRMREYRTIAEKYGTRLTPASPGFPCRVGGAITLHPLALSTADALMGELRAAGAEVRPTRPVDDRSHVYLSGCSFTKEIAP